MGALADKAIVTAKEELLGALGRADLEPAGVVDGECLRMIRAKRQVIMNQYVALLRGINVGGNNLIRMTDLKACFETQGFDSVSTYIQSGNVLFGSVEADQTRLTRKVEEVLSRTFNYQSRVVLRSCKQMRTIVDQAPRGFGSDPATYRYDVIFLKDPLTAVEALKNVTTKPGVDEAFTGKGVLYFSRLITKAAQSHLSRIVTLPVYKSMTIRNWNTTTKLRELMEVAGKRTHEFPLS